MHADKRASSEGSSILGDGELSLEDDDIFESKRGGMCRRIPLIEFLSLNSQRKILEPKQVYCLYLLTSSL